MALVTLRNVELAFGSDPLLEGASCAIETGERVCLLGRNGAGKSTLLAVVAGARAADAGEVLRDPATRVAALPQDVAPGLSGSVRGVVLSGLAETGALVEQHLEAAAAGDLRRMDLLQQRIEAAGAWDVERRVERTLSRLGLDPGVDFPALSGGLKRRALLARALVTAPDLLLLDEPTNHLDVDAIEWLEQLMLGWRGAVLFTTHDRRLLERTATRILELDRGRLSSWPGDYANYLRRRAEREDAETAANAEADRRLAGEEAWIRQGIEARRTRNQGRVRRLERMRRERAERRDPQGRVRFHTHAAGASGRKVVEARGASFGWNGEPVIRDLDLLVERGDRIGIIGPNGSGKTTLLNLLLGHLRPSAGEVVQGTRLEVAYFDQHRAALDPGRSVADSVADGAEFVPLADGRRHVIGYLSDFLFPAARARSPVRSLSGGERARLLLARLFAAPSNLLVMDEPTNDLDMETLELLEERLLEYPGTLLLVSHDRAFLDNVVTSTLVLEGGGRVGAYVGGYADWLRQRPPPPGAPRPPPTPAAKPTPPAPARRKLGYREQRELDALPARIESLEHDITRLQARLADPALYREDGAAVAAVREELARAEADLECCFARWSELEAAAG
jgi:ATP-binding cassette subfamily F protein uup